MKSTTLFFFRAGSFILVLLSVLITNKLNGQTLKKYSGEYESFLYRKPAKANYTYYIDEYGKKIKHGDFSYVFNYSESGGTVNQTATGKFSHGKRSGTWKIQTTLNGSFNNNVWGTSIRQKLNEVHTVVANYKEGLLDGTFKMTVSQNNKTPELNSSYTHNLQCNYTFKDGLFSGPVSIIETSSDKDDRLNLKGQFNEEGMCEGFWTIDERVMEFKNGILIRTQFWTQNEQDKLKKMIEKFLPLLNSSEEVLAQNELEKELDCSSMPVDDFIKYFNNYFNSDNFLGKYIEGDLTKTVSHGGCHYVLVDKSDKLDLTADNLGQQLQRAISTNNHFDFLSLMSSTGLSDRKPSVKYQLIHRKDSLLNILPTLVEEENDKIKRLADFDKQLDKYFENEFIKHVAMDKKDLFEIINPAGYKVKKDRKALIFDPGVNYTSNSGTAQTLKFYLPARSLYSDYISKINGNIIEFSQKQYYNDRKSNQRIEYLNVPKSTVDLMLNSFNSTSSKRIQLINLEDSICALIQSFEKMGKKSFEFAISENLTNKFDEAVLETYGKLANIDFKTTYKQTIQFTSEYETKLNQLSGLISSFSMLKERYAQFENQFLSLEKESESQEKGLLKTLTGFVLSQGQDIKNSTVSLTENLRTATKENLNSISAQFESTSNSISENLTKINALKTELVQIRTDLSTFEKTEFTNSSLKKLITGFVEAEAITLENLTLKSEKTISDQNTFNSSLTSTSVQIKASSEKLKFLASLSSKQVEKQKIKELNGLKKDPEALYNALKGL